MNTKSLFKHIRRLGFIVMALQVASFAAASIDAVDDLSATDAATVKKIPILKNDSGDFVFDSIAGNPKPLGSITVSNNGVAFYDPNGQFDYLNGDQTATDSFKYKLVDPNDDSIKGSAIVTVTITAAGDSSIAPANIETTTAVDSAIEIDIFSGTVGNYSFDRFAGTSNGGALYGDVEVSDSIIKYTPTTATVGNVDTIRYKYINDDSADATPTITLTIMITEGSTNPELTTHDIVVVGAGSAGLYAAKNLIDDGYDVLIIEATDRIGGRVKSASLGDMRVELGAEEHYLANGKNPVWDAVIAEYGESIYVDGYLVLDAYSMDSGSNTCWTKNNAFHNCADDADVTLVDDFWDWYWKPKNHLNADSTLADDLFDQFGVGSESRAYHLYDAGITGGSFATNLHKIGARSMALQDNQWELSEDIQVLGDKDLGYSDALETIWWNDVIASSELLLNSPVVKIDTSGDDVVITDAKGNLHAARQVIVTVSIGVLQAEIIDFEPNLPATTVAAYNGIGIDMGMKVPMRFSSAWWETEGQELGWVVTEGLAGACWAPSNYKVTSSSHILLCYPMGDYGTELNDIAADAGGGTAGDKAIIDAILADLDGTFPQAPNQASANYLEGIVQNWGAAPYTRGVYSYPKIGTYTAANDSKRLDLQDPVANNRIFFAGEGSHNSHPATVVGALHEGERAAKNVNAANGNPNNPPALPSGG